MKTSDLPSTISEVKFLDGDDYPSDSYYSVIEDSHMPLPRQPNSMWDMVDAIEEPFHEIYIHIYDTYHDQ